MEGEGAHRPALISFIFLKEFEDVSGSSKKIADLLYLRFCP